MPAAARMTFYTTVDMERAWADAYATALAEKQTDLDARQHRTKILEKYTAYAYVHQPTRVFHVANTDAVTCGGVVCPSAPTPGGRTYASKHCIASILLRFGRLASVRL